MPQRFSLILTVYMNQMDEVTPGESYCNAAFAKGAKSVYTLIYFIPEKKDEIKTMGFYVVKHEIYIQR